MLRRAVVVVGAAVVQFAVWLATMGDWARTWPEGGSPTTWLLLEAAVAAAVGAVASDRTTVVKAVAAGWLLQTVHFVVVTPKGEDHNLWAVGIGVLGFAGGIAVLLALAVRLLTGLARRRARG